MKVLFLLLTLGFSVGAFSAEVSHSVMSGGEICNEGVKVVDGGSDNGSDSSTGTAVIND